MKTILSLLLCMTLTSSFAQKCKYDVETTDAFTGTKTIGTTAKLPQGALIGFNLSNNKYWVGIFIEFFGEKNDKIAKGDSLLLKLGNGEIITLYTNDNYAPTSYVYGQGTSAANVKSYYKPNYTADAATMGKIAANPVTDLKFFMGVNNLPIAVDEKFREKIMNAAACILK
ncbi:MAG: hypothetical protein IPN36_06055 [Bacteroidetes bacterium]|nr:hypothetical protein [Bacteroidota bacterium]